jgi:hypothetical protein
MKPVAIFFVPAGAAQKDFETALREHFTSEDIGEIPIQMKTAKIEPASAEPLPLWTWFVPNCSAQFRRWTF